MTTPKVEPPKDEVTNMLDVMLDNFMLVHGTRNARTPQSKVELKAEILDYVKLQQEALLNRVEKEVINQLRDIYLTKDMVARGDYGDNLAKQWEYLRVKQRKSINKLRLEL
jgi:hypothetical protein